MPPDLESIARQMAAIGAQTPDWWHNPAALRRGAALWGGGADEHGVFTRCEREVIGRPGDGCYAELRIARSPNGLFAHAIAYQTTARGTSYQPGIWCWPHASRQAARRAAGSCCPRQASQPDGSGQRRTPLLPWVQGESRA